MELHEALQQCQQQLGETQSQWRSDVETLKVVTNAKYFEVFFITYRSKL